MNGVTFGKHHSYRTWKLLLAKQPTISPPAPKTKLIQVPGTSTVIDLTEALTGGEVKYEPRTIQCKFYVIGGRSKWPAVYSAVLNAVHGKRMRIVMDDDPNYYYEGRVVVDPLESNESAATIVISAEVEPYKKARHGEGRRL